MTTGDREGQVRFDALATRVYTERRLPSGTRDLILALGWVTLRDPQRHHPAHLLWAGTREVLNATDQRMWELLAQDAPRYAHDWTAGPKGCQAPMPRADRLCGRTAMHHFSEADLVTGRRRDWGFCDRPACRTHAEKVYRHAKKQNETAPEPIPNTGGMLPLFFDWDWEPKYRKASGISRELYGWEPPSYGLSADEWPAVPGEAPVQAFPKLRLAASHGEAVDVT
jgi:hypothetical protein